MLTTLTTALVAALLLGLSILAMSIGLLLRGKVMRGGCGSAIDEDGAPVACDACSKKKINLCDEDDSMGLAGVSFASTLGRFQRKPRS